MNTDKFFPAIRPTLFHGFMTQSQVDGVNAILGFADKHFPGMDLRWVSYILATAFHETDFTMQPVPEDGRGHGMAYGKPAGPFGQIYYGRGYVQLTWLFNYQHADAQLHHAGLLTPDQNLVKNPDLALDPDIAGAILVLGMTQGWFTHYDLSDFFNGHRTDYVHARLIINGLDCAAQIAVYAEHFRDALHL